jgi:hypothetical protein
MATEIIVQGVKLIPQDNTNACWWASSLMLYEWRKSQGGSPPDPRANAEISAAHRATNLLPWSIMKRYGAAIGLTPKPLLTPSADLLKEWLQSGPLWTDGIGVNWRGQVAGPGHVVVLTGLREVDNSDEWEIYVYDPWPVNTGTRGWRPISHLVDILRTGTNPGIDVNFMQY